MIRKEKIDGCDYWVSRDNQTGKILIQSLVDYGSPGSDRFNFSTVANFDAEIHSKFLTPELRAADKNITAVVISVSQDMNPERFLLLK